MIAEARRFADFITPIPKPRKQKAAQTRMVLGDTKGLSSEAQQYRATAEVINALRARVDA